MYRAPLAREVTRFSRVTSALGVAVDVAVAVAVAVGVFVGVAVAVAVAVGVFVGVAVAVAVAVGVAVVVGVAVGVAVVVGVRVGVAVGVGVDVDVGVAVGVDVDVAVFVGVAVGVLTVVSAVATLSTGFGSVMSEATLALFVITVPSAVLGLTCTTRPRVAVSPLGMSLSFVQSTCVPPRSSLHCQPKGDTNGRRLVLLGRVSVTTTLRAASGPLFCTVIR
jgi:hypothetical protein